MKKDITGLITAVDFFVFYQLLLGNRTIHLTFAEKKHKEAAGRLRNMSYQINYLPERQIKTAELAAMLVQRKSFTVFSQSIFIQKGTQLQQRVWELISQIPFGETRTYGDLAQALGNKGLARAVGQGCGANPIALLIPCHRVVGHTGLGGFGGGIDLKKKLLALEKKQITEPYSA
ncbi:MAG: methylated-DNA--[protein]-cysteine S-methyltransferase [Desulfobulbaceae bacterium]|nr:methylated-DNA--[protein]-cysteine S-methyltransferase [Desulfobulbaceae bacterium]